MKRTEEVTACFLKDETYFISQNCADLSCGFIRGLKKDGLSTTQKERPGAATCRDLGGALDDVSLSGASTVERCVFKDDGSFISLNLLESWDGKKFTGPAKKINGRL